MMTTPTQPPDKCPACGCTEFDREFDPNEWEYIFGFTCGTECVNENGKWKVDGLNCNCAFSAAIALRAALDDQHAATDRMHNELTALRAERDAALAQVESWRKRIEAHMDYIEPKIDRTQENVEKLVDEKNALAARLAELPEQIRRDAREIPVGEAFETGPLGGTSKFNVHVYAADIVQSFIDATPGETK